MRQMKSLTITRMAALLMLVGLTIGVPILGAKRPDIHIGFDRANGPAAEAPSALDPRRIIIFLPQ